MKITQWYWYLIGESSQWQGKENGSIKNILKSKLEINFLKLKEDKLCKTVGFTKRCSRSLKRDNNSELFSSAGKLISSDFSGEIQFANVFLRFLLSRFYLLTPTYTTFFQKHRYVILFENKGKTAISFIYRCDNKLI